MKAVLFFYLLLSSNLIVAQEFLNLGFEYTIPGTQQPEKWYVGSPPYEISIDSIEKIQLLNSLKIECKSFVENSYGFTATIFPYEYVKGRSIELKGKIKTENVIKGYAGLWISAKKDDASVAIDNMANRGLQNTNDWKEVSIKMHIDKTVNHISFGVLLTGQGKAWFDDLEIYIDGVKFNDIKIEAAQPTEAEIAWLKQKIHPLKTYEIVDNNDDLTILNRLIGDSKIVALGESTHGSSEIFKMKHRIIKFLVDNNDFEIFSIEANMPEAYDLNKYIIDGQGNPIDLIKGMHFWTWSTQEMLSMVNWMKIKNQGDQKIYYTGFDMQYYNRSIDILEGAFENNKHALKLTASLRKELGVIAEQKRKMQSNFVSPKQRKDISKLLVSIRKEMERTASEKETDWLAQNVRIIEQYNYEDKRDRYMAENIKWIQTQNPNKKIVVWAHNGHVKKTGNSTGKFLAADLGSDYLSIGFAFYEGDYTAHGENGLTSYKAEKANVGSYEYLFNKVDAPIFILDLREIKNSETALSKKLLQNSLFRNVGALKTTNEFYKTDLTEDFDIIIFIKKSTNSILLD